MCAPRLWLATATQRVSVGHQRCAAVCRKAWCGCGCSGSRCGVLRVGEHGARLLAPGPVSPFCCGAPACCCPVVGYAAMPLQALLRACASGVCSCAGRTSFAYGSCTDPSARPCTRTVRHRGGVQHRHLRVLVGPGELPRAVQGHPRRRRLQARPLVRQQGPAAAPRDRPRVSCCTPCPPPPVSSSARCPRCAPLAARTPGGAAIRGPLGVSLPALLTHYQRLVAPRRVCRRATSGVTRPRARHRARAASTTTTRGSAPTAHRRPTARAANIL